MYRVICVKDYAMLFKWQLRIPRSTVSRLWLVLIILMLFKASNTITWKEKNFTSTCVHFKTLENDFPVGYETDEIVNVYRLMWNRNGTLCLYLLLTIQHLRVDHGWIQRNSIAECEYTTILNNNSIGFMDIFWSVCVTSVFYYVIYFIIIFGQYEYSLQWTFAYMRWV